MVDTKTHNKSRHNDRHEELHAVKEDLRRLREDLSGLAGDVLSASRSEFNQGTHALSSEAKHRLEQIRSMAHDARDCGHRTIEEARHKVEERPLMAVFGALAAGAAIGMLVGWSRGR